MGKRILVSPLNWGLGHATRCLPIIRSLVNQGNKVIIAADGGALSFLQKAMPELEFIKLPGFNATYSKRNSQALKIAISTPRALRDFSNEHQQLDTIVKDYNIEAIISDNRFGCWNKNVKSVFITHQLHISIPKLWRWTAPIVNSINYSYIKHYDELWIPDAEGNINLAGALSHPANLPIKTSYIGYLSRFYADSLPNNEKDIDYLVILSGPEPQRTILEKIIIKQAYTIKEKIVILRAMPDCLNMIKDLPDNVTTFNHVDDEMFVNLVSSARNIICRGGYSSLMDLIRLNRSAFLIPTPGQTEQEYLSQYLFKKGLFGYCKQKDFNFKNVAIPQINLRSIYNDESDNINTFLERWCKTI